MSDAIRLVEGAVYKEEESELSHAREGGKFPALAVDAAESRLQRYRGVSVVFESASSGSVILVGAVLGLAVWILNQTIGETLKETWLESDSHRDLKSFLAFSIDGKASRIVERIRRKKLKSTSYSGVIDANLVEEQGLQVIDVSVRPSLPDELREEL